MLLKLRLFLKNFNEAFHFLKTIYVADVFRIALVIIVPVWWLFESGLSKAGMAFGTGTILASLLDYPGVQAEKNKAFQLTILLFLLISFVSASLLNAPVLLSFAIFSCCLGGGLLTAYGPRSSVVGSACIVLFIFVIGLKPVAPVSFSILVTLGVCWAFAVSLLIAFLRPFSAIHHVVGECIREISGFISSRKFLYDKETDLNESLQQIIANHAKVSQKQETVRSFILSEKKIVRKRHRQGKHYLALAIVLIDLYEQLSAMPFDYEVMRDNLSTESRQLVIRYIELIAGDLDQLGRSLQSRRKYNDNLAINASIAEVNEKFEMLINSSYGLERQLLKGILKNTTAIINDLNHLRKLVTAESAATDTFVQLLNYEQFIDSPNYHWKQLLPHFKLQSPIFRFAIRLAVVMTLAFIFSTVFPLGVYSYWIMLTIAIVLRPAFSVTSIRNVQRLTGTVIGLIIGIILAMSGIHFSISIAVLCIGLVGFFCFLQVNYTVSVAFITCVVITGLSLTGGIQKSVITERFLDTLLGCGLSLLAAFIFPSWEAKHLNAYINDLLKASMQQMENFSRWMAKKDLDPNTYKLARKSIYTASANLSMALKRIKGEPVQYVVDKSDIIRFIILNNFLFATIASFEIYKPMSADLEFKAEEMNASTVATEYLKYGLNREQLVLPDDDHKLQAASFNYDILDDNDGFLTQKMRLNYIKEICRQINFYKLKISI